MIERTKFFYERATHYRQALRDIWAEFDTAAARLEQYRGSKGYEEQIEAAEKDRDERVKALQAETRADFNVILAGMRQSATSQEMNPPTAEQLALLQALQMRERVSRDELMQAARTLKECPVALSVLQEIGERQEPRFLLNHQGFAVESTKSILAHIDELSSSAKRICALNKPDSRGDMTERASFHHGGQGVNALYSWRVDRDVSSVSECMELFGGVSDLKAFESAVNS